MPLADAATCRAFEERARSRSRPKPKTEEPTTSCRSEFSQMQHNLNLSQQQAEDPRVFGLLTEKVQLDREIRELRKKADDEVSAQIVRFAEQNGFTSAELQIHPPLFWLVRVVLRSRQFKEQVMSTFKPTKDE